MQTYKNFLLFTIGILAAPLLSASNSKSNSNNVLNSFDSFYPKLLLMPHSSRESDKSNQYEENPMKKVILNIWNDFLEPIKNAKKLDLHDESYKIFETNLINDFRNMGFNLQKLENLVEFQKPLLNFEMQKAIPIVVLDKNSQQILGYIRKPRITEHTRFNLKKFRKLNTDQDNNNYYKNHH